MVLPSDLNDIVAAASARLSIVISEEKALIVKRKIVDACLGFYNRLQSSDLIASIKEYSLEAIVPTVELVNNPSAIKEALRKTEIEVWIKACDYGLITNLRNLIIEARRVGTTDAELCDMSAVYVFIGHAVRVNRTKSIMPS